MGTGCCFLIAEICAELFCFCIWSYTRYLQLPLVQQSYLILADSWGLMAFCNKTVFSFFLENYIQIMFREIILGLWWYTDAYFCKRTTRFGYWAVCMCYWMKVKVYDQSVSPVEDYEVTAYISTVIEIK